MAKNESQQHLPADGRRRVVIEGVEREIDGGRFPAKRVVGENVVVEADIFTDGHDVIEAAFGHLLPAAAGRRDFGEAPRRYCVDENETPGVRTCRV